MMYRDNLPEFSFALVFLVLLMIVALSEPVV